MAPSEQCPGCVRLVGVAKDQENAEQRLSGILDDFKELKLTIQECITGVQSGVKMLTEGAHRFERNEQDFMRHTSGEDGAHFRMKEKMTAMERKLQFLGWSVLIIGLTWLTSEHGKQGLDLLIKIAK